MVGNSQYDLARIFSALILPCKEDESVNYSAIADLVEMQIGDGVEGFYCCGSSGEGLLMTLDERKKFLEAVISASGGRVPVIAHVGTIRTKDVIDLAQHAKSAGSCAISMIPPYYYNFSMEELFCYYEDVINAVPDIPVILYNIPQFTRIEFSKDNAKRLLDNPRIIGIKHTSMNLYSLERMISSYPDKIFINGFDEQYRAALAMGAKATISTTANLFAPLFKGIRDAYLAKKNDEALALQKKLNHRVEVLVKVGIFSGTKYGCTLRGVDSGLCRAPFKALCDEEKKAVENLLKEPY